MKYIIFRYPRCRGDREAWLLSDGGNNIPDVVGDWKPIKTGSVRPDQNICPVRGIEDYILEVSAKSMTGCKLDGLGVLGMLPGDVVDLTAEPGESKLLDGAWLYLEHGCMKLGGSFHEEVRLSMETGRWSL